MPSRAGLQKSSKRLALPSSCDVRRMEEEVTTVAKDPEDVAPTSEDGEECPVAMGTPEPSYVLSIYERRKYNIPSVGEDDTLFCRILNKRVEPSRLTDKQ
ncbi:hypothetical protein ANCCAN_19667 [Ancylostoma caninum]|uniref:Uncharacterized protein n=1 Tax=Ancylostoma caninum TaxID=29170 RepID=A0A368FUJ4_ANCCA|nr:hypothetical protein ANCCAN_19667 [Ancylostoma caninum]